MRRLVIWCLVVGISGIGLIPNWFLACASTQDLSALLNQAGKQVAHNRLPEALTTLREAMSKIWERTPMFVAKAILVKEKPSGFGLYESKQDNIYNSGEPILLYLEPVGFAIEKKGDHYEFGMTADFSVLTEDGKVLGGRKGFGRWALKSRNFNTEFYLDLKYTITGLKAGPYIIETTLRDLKGPGVASVRTAIEIK